MTNPYAPPRSLVEDVADPSGTIALADRGSRLGASILDSFFFMALAYVPAFAGMIAAGIVLGGPGQPNAAGLTPAAVIGLLIGLVGFGVWCWLTIKYVKANGQSIGKKLLRIKVTRRDGSPISLGRLFWLRNVVNTLLSLIPLYGFIDVLFIFGEARECIHDKIAGTIVVKA